MIAKNIVKTVIKEYSDKGWACIPEMQIGDLASDLKLVHTGLQSSRSSGGLKSAWSMRPDIWLVNRDKEIIIIEVKSCRSDFTSDNKWHIYRQFCNKFYFAIDGDYISKEELPKGVGLLKLDTNEKRGYSIIKKANKYDLKLSLEHYTDLMFRMARSLSNRQCILKIG